MKSQLRKYAKEYRKNLNTKELSLKIYEQLINLNEYKKAKNICSYYSFGNEVCTDFYFQDTTKKWYLPRIDKEDLKICPYNKENMVINSSYKIPEPLTKEETNPEKIDMIIIPALAADKNGYRIGYGKGYYDRLLKSLPHHPLKIVLVYSDLLFENIYPESFDEKSNIIITDKEVYRINC